MVPLENLSAQAFFVKQGGTTEVSPFRPLLDVEWGFFICFM